MLIESVVSSFAQHEFESVTVRRAAFSLHFQVNKTRYGRTENMSWETARQALPLSVLKLTFE